MQEQVSQDHMNNTWKVIQKATDTANGWKVQSDDRPPFYFYLIETFQGERLFPDDNK